MSKDEPIKRACVVGGGNAAHAMAALFPSRGIPCHVFAPFGNEAERIRAGIREQGHIRAEFASHNEPAGSILGCPEKVSADASEVVPGCDVVILPLPSFTYGPVFEHIGPHLGPGTVVGVTPGQGGVDWVAREVLGPVLDAVTLAAVMPMPFNCRVTRFGKQVEVQTFKRRYRVATLPRSNERRALTAVKSLFGHAENAGHFVGATLYPMNAVIHPSRLYTVLRDWRPGTVLTENPRFYEDMTADAVSWMERVSGEAVAIGRRLCEAGLRGLEVPNISDFLMSYVYRDTAADLRTFFATNPAYRGFSCPFTQVEGGWVPDFSSRYFTEDIPYGLCVYKGLGQLAGMETPAIDEILTWVQELMGKEYLVSGALCGADVRETGAPQRYGICSLQALVERYR